MAITAYPFAGIFKIQRGSTGRKQKHSHKHFCLENKYATHL